MVTLKLKVTPEVFAKLHSETKRPDSSFKILGHEMRSSIYDDSGSIIDKYFVNFVRILPGDRKFDGNETEIVLELADQYSNIVNGRKESVQTDRTMLDKLCDMTGIFPRNKPILSMEDLKWLQDAIGRLDFLFGWTLRNVGESPEVNQEEFKEMRQIIQNIRTLAYSRE